MLKDVDPKKNAPKFYKDKPWTYLFQNRRVSTLDKIDKIFSLGKHVDAQLRATLFKMQRSLYLREHYAFNSSSYEKDYLAEYSLVFYNYFELIQELLGFYQKNLKKYYERSLTEKMHILTPIGDDKFKIETQYRKKKK